MNTRSYTLEEYIERVQAFHGFAGGIMVAIAYQHLPEGGLLDAVCEVEVEGGDADANVSK